MPTVTKLSSGCSATTSDSPARNSVAVRASAARARCSSTARSTDPARSRLARWPMTMRSSPSRGSGNRGSLSPLQTAFVEHTAFGCGYCTPGMIVTADALLRRNPRPSRNDIVEAMDDNLCRCASYPSIIKAIESVVETAGQAGGLNATDPTVVCRAARQQHCLGRHVLVLRRRRPAGADTRCRRMKKTSPTTSVTSSTTPTGSSSTKTARSPPTPAGSTWGRGS